MKLRAPSFPLLSAGRVGDRGRNRGISVCMESIRISEAEAAGDFAGLMARVRAGA